MESFEYCDDVTCATDYLISQFFLRVDDTVPAILLLCSAGIERSCGIAGRKENHNLFGDMVTS